ncbi:30S ribosomal protein S6 [Thermocrinis jamiesonii]|jgi:SSU ribosomal protein S6P|uniref:30S ribosomal protein S6 n=1 Tax=Thermocrinis jamiesonii TaxID=1302351 RepID=UPI0004975514|nr:30S ribosomal protein S6 [Thermocrinis jamiesonii]
MAKRYYETTRYYESVIVLKPTLSEEEVSRRVQEIKDYIAKKGGEVLGVTDWGLKQLAYRINHFSSGRYFIIQIKSSNPELPNDLDFYYRINEDVIRWLNFRVSEKEITTNA